MQLGWDDEPKRKAVRGSDRTHLLEFQNGKCAKCKKSFKEMGVRKVVHHKNLNPKDNRIVNLMLVCPNCHDKIHQKEKKVRVKTTDAFGFPDYKVVKKIVKKKTKSSTPKKKRVPAERDIFGNVVRWKYITPKSTKKKTVIKKKSTTKKKTTSKATSKRKRVAAERDIFGNVIRWKYVAVKPKKSTKKKR